VAQQLLLRYGVVTRETAAAEELPGGFSAFYPALRQMEERGWIRRGMFLSGLGGSQFAMNAAVESLRALRSASSRTALTLSAVDPANPYGSLLPWPRLPEADDATQSAHGMARIGGASVVLVAGELVAYLRRGNPALKLFLPAAEPERDEYARQAARQLARTAIASQSPSTGVLIAEINAGPARQHFFGRFLEEAGFRFTALGYQISNRIRDQIRNSTRDPMRDPMRDVRNSANESDSDAEFADLDDESGAGQLDE
jgi:ATP-dependent Lhr-like helicase